MTLPAPFPVLMTTPAVQAPARPVITNDALERLHQAIVGAEVPQVPLPLRHYFLPGVYCREFTVPAGVFVIGHEHRGECLNVMLSGRARLIMTDGSTKDITAPDVFGSGAGVRKAAWALETMRFLTVHSNPTDERDVVKLEELLCNFSPEFLAQKGAMTLDDFRMSLNHARPALTP